MTKHITRILLVDDHELFRTGIASLLNNQPDFEVVGEAADGIEAHYRAVDIEPELILMDINMPGVDGVEATKLILTDLPNSTIIMFTVHDDDEKVFDAIRAGAKGYILKNANSEEFLKLLRGVITEGAALSPQITERVISAIAKSPKPKNINSKITLTNREKEVLKIISEGKMDKEIAKTLSISLHTVKSHVRNILSKLKVENRREAAEFAKEAEYFPKSKN